MWTAHNAIRRCNMSKERQKQLVPSGLRPLLLAVGCFLVLGTLFTWYMPPFEGPDEAQHFAYVTWLAEGHGFPPQGEAAWETPIEQEASQPPFYYLMAALPAAVIELDAPPATYRPNPHFVAPLPRAEVDNDNRAIHYPADAAPLRGGWLAFYAGRFVTLAFGALLVIAVYGLAREVVPSAPPVAWAASLLVATTPQVLFIGSVVSNDIPAATLATLTLWFLARLLRRGPGRGRALAVGIAFGLAILTKASTLALALPLALGIGWFWASGRYDLRMTAATALWSGLSAFAVGGWWFVRSWFLYGSPLGLETHDVTPWAINDPTKLGAFGYRWLDTLRSYWIAFGWGTIRPPGWVYQLLFLLMLAAGLGLALAVWRWWRRPERQLDTRAVLLILLTLTLLLVSFMLELWMRRVQAPLGRLLFPAIGAFTLLLILGWRNLHPRLPFLAVGFVGVLSVLSPFLIIGPAFAYPKLLSPAEVEMLPEHLGVRFGPATGEPVAELLSVTPATDTHEIGAAVLPVRVCWRALAETDTNYTVLLHLIGPENRLVANRRSYPGLGRYPTSLWHSGDAFCDLMHVRVFDHQVPRTLRYLVEVALIDESTDRRLQVFAPDGRSLPGAFVDEVVIRKETETWPAPAGEEPLQLLDYELPGRWYAGREHSLWLQWGVAAPVDKNYQVFVHLRDRESGENVAQADGPPLAGWYPTSRWLAGEIVEEERTFPLPAELPPGRYRLVVGFYELETGMRFGPEHDLGPVTVQP